MFATHRGNDHKERVNSNFLATVRIDVRPINACAFPFLPQYHYWSKPCEKHVKIMWKTWKFHLLFHMGMCENSVKSPCENQVKWDGPFHIMDDVKKLCEIGNSHHALYTLGLMIWCEKLCETCEKTMWNKKIHIMHCKTRLNDMMWKTMWNLFWLTCKHVKFQFHILFQFILIIPDPVCVPGRTYIHADHAHAHDLYAAYIFM